MIDVINNTLQFDFVINTYLPAIVKVFIPLLISVGIALIFITIGNLLKSTIIKKVFYIFGTIAVVAFCITIAIIGIMGVMMPILLSIIAIKFYAISIFTSIPEVAAGIGSTILCFAIVAGCLGTLLKTIDEPTKE